MNNSDKIARFMGLQVYPSWEEMRKVPLDKLSAWLTIEQCDRYQKSWDWLMPVVEKIQETEIKDRKIIRSAADVQIMYKACHIYYYDDNDEGEFECQIRGETKIEAVYKAVLQFIDWFNQQQKP